VTLFFFRIRFFAAWAKVIRRFLGIKETPCDRRKLEFPKSSLEQPDSTGLVIHLHTPSKEYLENQSQHQHTPQIPPVEYTTDRFHDSDASISSRDSEGRTSRQEGGTKRSLSNPFKKDKSKKPSVEDILAMRRLAEFGDQGLTYPGIQPVMLSGHARPVFDV
jgi:hypothetical protein